MRGELRPDGIMLFLVDRLTPGLQTHFEGDSCHVSCLSWQMDNPAGARRFERGGQELNRQQAEITRGMHRALAKIGVHELPRGQMHWVELIFVKRSFFPYR